MARFFFVAASVTLGVGVLWAGGCAPDLTVVVQGADGGGAGGPMACETAADCGEETPCGKPLCTAEGTCAWTSLSPDMSTPAGLTNVYGDCKRQYCMGGQVVTVDPENDDVYVYGNPCFKPECQAGGNMSPAPNPGVECDIDMNTKGVCSGEYKCAECLADGDCTSKMCRDGKCVTDATCGDGQKNGDETDLDCGGSCAPCADGLACGAFLDCESRRCIGGQCVSTCTDTIKNGKETDLDCGGPDCPPCSMNQVCNYATDCESGRCEGGVCMPKQ